MQRVSKAYKSQIKKIPFRNRVFVNVIVGVINKEAQNSIAFDRTLDYMPFSDFDKPFTKEVVKNRYSTYENNFIIPDGKSFVFAEKEPYTLYQGVVLKNLNENVVLDLGKEHSLAGLTIHFGSKYPTKFNLILDEETRLIENNKSEWLYTEPLTTSRIEIEPLEWVNGGSARLRIENFKCGYYKEFNNTELLSLKYNESHSPISAELTQNSATINIDNTGRKFDVENSNDLSKFFIVGQDVNINFGLELDDGSIEYVDYGDISLDTWSIDSKTLKLSANSYLNTLEDLCLIGEYSEDGKSLYDLAVEVFTDLGINPRNYTIDYNLKNIITHNPLPQLSHAQLLQIIANAGQCTLLRDRSGMYKIIPTCFNSTEDIEFSLSDNGHTENSHVDKILDLESNIKSTYGADYSKDYLRVDNKIFFADAEGIGYVSNEVADSEGNFETNPIVTITTNKAFQFLGWTFDFIGAIPQEMIIRAFYGVEKIYENTFMPNEVEFKADDMYGFCDKIEVEFTKGYPNARVHISNITTPPIVFTFTTQRDVIDSTKATIKNNTKTLELESTIYEKATEISEAFTSEIEIEDGIDYSNYEVIFSNCIVPTTFTINGTSITPISYSGQHCILDLSSYSVGDIVNLVVNGYSLTTKTRTYRKNLNEKGTTETYQNPLIDNEALARNNLKWLGIFENYVKTYEIESRGYPELELNDLVGLEIPQLNKIATQRIISQSLTFNSGALRGKTITIREE